MPTHYRRLKVINLAIDSQSIDCQLTSWTLDPGQDDGDVNYTYCPDGSFISETDAEPTLDITFVSDWTSAGFSAYLWEHNGETADFTLDHHPDVPGEHVRWTGQLKIKPGPAGGDRGDDETTEVTFQIIPTSLTFERVA